MEYEIQELILLFFFGNLAGLINVMAGGGSSLTLPFLIFMGMDASVANGTNRIGVIAQTASATLSFRKEKFSDFSLSLKFAILTIPGGIIGAFYSTEINDDTFETILGIIMIGIVISMLIPKSKKDDLKETLEKLPLLSYPIMILVGFYGGFIQIGVGFILMAVLNHLFKLNLVRVNMHKVFIVFLYTIPALIVFILTDNIEWLAGIILAAGTSLGAWWSAKISIQKGEKFIKLMLVIAVLLMSLNLLEVY